VIELACARGKGGGGKKGVLESARLGPGTPARGEISRFAKVKGNEIKSSLTSTRDGGKSRRGDFFAETSVTASDSNDRTRTERRT